MLQYSNQWFGKIQNLIDAATHEIQEWGHAKHLASLSFHSGSTESTKKRDFCKLNLEAGNENTQSCFFQIMPLFHLSMVAYKDLYQVLETL